MSMEIEKIVIAVGAVVSAVVGLLVVGDFDVNSLLGEATGFIESKVTEVIGNDSLVDMGKELLSDLSE